jgi:sugar phosphate isomerase/epimerase
MWRGPALDAMRELLGTGVNDFDIMTVPGHLWPEDLDSSSRRRLRQALISEGIRIESLNPPSVDYNLASCVTDVRAAAVQMYSRLLELGAEIGVRNVVVVPGRVGSLLAPKLENTLGWLESGFQQLLRVAEKNDQRLYVEMIPLSPISKVDRLIPFLDRFDGNPRMLVAYDVASAEFMGEDQVSALRSIGKRLGQTHLSDSPRQVWRHDRVGLGTVKFPEILATLRGLPFGGVNILEIISTHPEADIAASLQALKAIR